MALWLSILLAPLLWLTGAIFFDFVHFVLHVMLRSRWRPLRALAHPHQIHHEWINRDLEVCWEYQRRNIGCHLVLEYFTQLVFTGVIAVLLPLPFAVVLATIQTLIFLLILRERGLDINHRPIEILDAYRPGLLTPPAYHALHHVYPDAHYSAYTKLVDVLVAGGTQLRGRRALIQHAAGPLGQALSEVLGGKGVAVRKTEEALDEAVLRETDILVLCDPGSDEIAILESFIHVTQTRKLPPEAWVIHTHSEDSTARHYVDDIRINYRTLVVPDADDLSVKQAAAAADRAVKQIRRGFHYVSTAPFPKNLRGRRDFYATQAVAPDRARCIRHRSDRLATD